jgi:hypothetical protein
MALALLLSEQSQSFLLATNKGQVKHQGVAKKEEYGAAGL